MTTPIKDTRISGTPLVVKKEVAAFDRGVDQIENGREYVEKSGRHTCGRSYENG